MDEQKKLPETPEEAKAAPLNNQQKTALLRYLTIMFAVAFLLVLVSLLVQSHNSKAALSEVTQSSSDALTSAVANAEFLQDQNRALQDENAELRQQLEALETVMDEQEKALDSAMHALAQSDENVLAAAQAEQDLKTMRQTYDALITAMTCTTHEGNVTFSRAMDTVEKNQALLSESALRVFESLLNEE